MGNNFTVVKGESDTIDTNRIMRTIAIHDCWKRQYYSVIQKVIRENADKKIAEYPQEDLMKIALSGIKYINALRDVRRENERIDADYKQTLEEHQAMFSLMDSIFMIMGHIKLKNLIITFPITKEFDGEKWGEKDYFYTMQVLSEMGLDKAIGREGITELLWDYQNDDLRYAYIEYMCTASALYRAQTGVSMAEKFCDDMGIGTYTVNNEAGIIRDNQTGQIMKLKKRSHLQVVK